MAKCISWPRHLNIVCAPRLSYLLTTATYTNGYTSLAMPQHSFQLCLVCCNCTCSRCCCDGCNFYRGNTRSYMYGSSTVVVVFVGCICFCFGVSESNALLVCLLAIVGTKLREKHLSSFAAMVLVSYNYKQVAKRQQFL